MNELLASIRADLTDRRLFPAVALVALLLIAAVAYAVLGGSSSAPTPRAATGTSSGVTGGGLSVSSEAPEQAVAETTDGFKEQKGGTARNPFTPLPGTGSSATVASSSTPATSSAGSSSTTGSSASSTSSGAAAPTTTPSSGGSSSAGSGSSSAGSGKGSEKKKAKTVYDVAIEFGEVPPGTTPEDAQLTPYAKLRLQTPLPTAQQPLIVFRGVTPKGRSATFTLVGEAILSGTGACLPSASQCEAVDVKPGETEQLSYIAPTGQTTVYELRVLGITAEKNAKTARAAWASSKAGEQLLRLRGITSLPFLRYSSQPGVLVFAPRRASAARARIALVRARG